MFYNSQAAQSALPTTRLNPTILSQQTGIAGHMASSFNELASFIWSVADLLRCDFKQSEYGRVILPFTVLHCLDCVLAPTSAAVTDELGAPA